MLGLPCPLSVLFPFSLLSGGVSLTKNHRVGYLGRTHFDGNWSVCHWAARAVEAGARHRVDDSLAVDSVLAIQVRNIARLAESRHAQRPHPISAHAAKP